jgi:hypothetical protein
MAKVEGVGAQSSIYVEVWQGFRPYLLKISVDFLITITLWVVLFLFKLLTKWLSIDGWAAEFIVNVHAAGAFGAFLVFAALLVADLYFLHRAPAYKGRGHDAE